MKMEITADRYCERCRKQTRVRLVRNIAANGANQVYWLCLLGNHSNKKNGAFIPHELVRKKVDPDELPVIENYSGYELCAVCGSPFTELNHWAPRHLFGDECELWPKDYLCKKHHDQWHALVTPEMSKTWKQHSKSLSQTTNSKAN